MLHLLAIAESPFLSLSAILLHIVLLVLVLAASFGLFRRRSGLSRIARAGTWLFVWGLVAVILALGLDFDQLHRHALIRRPQPAIRATYMSLVWVAVLSTLLFSVTRQAVGGVPTIPVILTALCGFSLLVLFLRPTSSTAREAVRRTECRRNLKEIHAGFNRYHGKFGTFPAARFDDAGDAAVSWRVEILPYLEQSSVPEPYDRTQPWDAAANLPAARSLVWGYACPSNHDAFDKQKRFHSAYSVLTGPETIFREDRSLSPPEIADGSSQTILVGEACGHQIVWTEPRDISVTEHFMGVNLTQGSAGPSRGLLSSPHEGGAHAVFADGSVRFINEFSTDPEVLRAMTTASAGDSVPEW